MIADTHLAAPWRLIGMIKRTAAPLAKRARLFATRRQLDALDDHILKDIGLLRGEIGIAVRRLR